MSKTCTVKVLRTQSTRWSRLPTITSHSNNPFLKRLFVLQWKSKPKQHNMPLFRSNKWTEFEYITILLHEVPVCLLRDYILTPECTTACLPRTSTGVPNMRIPQVSCNISFKILGCRPGVGLGCVNNVGLFQTSCKWLLLLITHDWISIINWLFSGVIFWGWDGRDHVKMYSTVDGKQTCGRIQ